MVFNLEPYYKARIRWSLENFRGANAIQLSINREALADAIYVELHGVRLSLNLDAKQIHVSKYNPREKECVKKFTAIVCKAWCNLAFRDQSNKVGINGEMIDVASYLAHQLVGSRLTC